MQSSLVVQVFVADIWSLVDLSSSGSNQNICNIWTELALVSFEKTIPSTQSGRRCFLQQNVWGTLCLSQSITHSHWSRSVQPCSCVSFMVSGRDSLSLPTCPLRPLGQSFSLTLTLRQTTTKRKNDSSLNKNRNK